MSTPSTGKYRVRVQMAGRMDHIPYSPREIVVTADDESDALLQAHKRESMRAGLYVYDMAVIGPVD